MNNGLDNMKYKFTVRNNKNNACVGVNMPEFRKNNIFNQFLKLGWKPQFMVTNKFKHD